MLRCDCGQPVLGESSGLGMVARGPRVWGEFTFIAQLWEMSQGGSCLLPGLHGH